MSLARLSKVKDGKLSAHLENSVQLMLDKIERWEGDLVYICFFASLLQGYNFLYSTDITRYYSYTRLIGRPIPKDLFGRSTHCMCSLHSRKRKK